MIYVIAGNQAQYNDYCRSRGFHPMSGEATPLVMQTDLLNVSWSEGDELVVTGTRNPLEGRFRSSLASRGMPVKNA